VSPKSVLAPLVVRFFKLSTLSNVKNSALTCLVKVLDLFLSLNLRNFTYFGLFSLNYSLINQIPIYDIFNSGFGMDLTLEWTLDRVNLKIVIATLWSPQFGASQNMKKTKEVHKHNLFYIVHID
jgi:hypothetical protein